MNPGIMFISILVLFAYLLGSLPFSQLITSWRTGLNLRALGELLVLTPLSSVGGLAVLGLVYLLTRDFNPSVAVGIIAMIVLPVLLREPLWVAGYVLALALLAGLKKL